MQYIYSNHGSIYCYGEELFKKINIGNGCYKVTPKQRCLNLVGKFLIGVQSWNSIGM